MDLKCESLVLREKKKQNKHKQTLRVLFRSDWKKESWCCSSWRREGCRESLEPLQVPKGVPRELERGFEQGHEVTRHGRMALNGQRAGLDYR